MVGLSVRFVAGACAKAYGRGLQRVKGPRLIRGAAGTRRSGTMGQRMVLRRRAHGGRAGRAEILRFRSAPSRQSARRKQPRPCGLWPTRGPAMPVTEMAMFGLGPVERALRHFGRDRLRTRRHACRAWRGDAQHLDLGGVGIGGRSRARTRPTTPPPRSGPRDQAPVQAFGGGDVSSRGGAAPRAPGPRSCQHPRQMRDDGKDHDDQRASQPAIRSSAVTRRRRAAGRPSRRGRVSRCRRGGRREGRQHTGPERPESPPPQSARPATPAKGRSTGPRPRR